MKFMDDEKLEKTIEFILNNQAQFTVDIQKIQEIHIRSRKTRECFGARVLEFIYRFR